MTTTLQNDLFQRPAGFWLRRAERLKQSGDLIRAAVVERHAARAHPDSDAACMSYALTLRQLHCYEASNREAFAALADDPSRTVLFGLIGQNLISMGMRQEGLDALGLYMHLLPPEPEKMPAWHEDACDMAYACDLPDTSPRRRARLSGLLQIAARRTYAGDLQSAKRALTRAYRRPFQGTSSRRDMISALYHQRTGQKELAAQAIFHALSLRPRSAQAAAEAAGMLASLDMRRPALAALTRAAAIARTPADEFAVCLASETLRAPHIVLGMLTRSLSRRADRYPVCYNLCVCLLKLGRLESAVPHIHLCREIDPDDAPGEVLFGRVMEMEQRNLSPAQVRKEALGISYYGAFSTPELSACLAPILALTEQGPEALARALETDVRMRRRFLHLMALPLSWNAGLLDTLLPHMDPKRLESLLREVLWQHPAPSQAKLHAASLLQHMGVAPPYGLWQESHLLLTDPTRPPSPTPTFRQRLLTLRIHQSKRFCPDDRRIHLWAMEMVHRMTPKQRNQVIADPARVWPLAFAVRFRALHLMPPVHVPDIHTLNSLRAKALAKALRTLHSLSAN